MGGLVVECVCVCVCVTAMCLLFGAGTRECWVCCWALSSSSELISKSKLILERYNSLLVWHVNVVVLLCNVVRSAGRVT